MYVHTEKCPDQDGALSIMLKYILLSGFLPLLELEENKRNMKTKVS